MRRSLPVSSVHGVPRSALRRIAASCVSLLLLAGPAATAQPDERQLGRDLRSVIILAGYPCRAIESYTHPNPNDYHVWCAADRQYGVHVSEEKGVIVESRTGAADAAPRDLTTHEAIMQRHLFAIVNLAGHECGRVLDFERRGPRDSIVRCEDDSAYRIRVTPEGRVSVDPHTDDK